MKNLHTFELIKLELLFRLLEFLKINDGESSKQGHIWQKDDLPCENG